MTTATKEDAREGARYALAGKFFYRPEGISFLDYVYILEPTQLFNQTQSGQTKMIIWPHTAEMATAFTSHQKNVVIKARQIGFSWLVAAYAIWLITFHEGSNVLMISRGELEAQTLLGKAKYIYRSLPDAWKMPIGDDSKSLFSIPSMDSKIVALPSTQHAGRSETATAVLQDEAEFHEHLGPNMNATGPTIDAGGQIIMGSTVDKWSYESIFKELVRESDLFKKEDDDGVWHGMFFPWDIRPGRDQAWFERVKSNVPEAELKGMSREFYMSGEYPSTLEEALAPASASSFFKREILNGMLEYVRMPVEVDGHINVYQRWNSRMRLVAGSDTSHGVGRDYNVTVVYDLNASRVVADIYNNNISPDLLGYESVRMLHEYKNPIWAIEDNEWGIETIRTAQGLNYPRLYARKEGTEKTAPDYGWHTNETNRFKVWGDFRQFVDTGDVIIPNRAGLNELFTVISNPEKKGRPEAMAGANDDYCMALGLAIQMRDLAYKNTGTRAKIRRN